MDSAVATHASRPSIQTGTPATPPLRDGTQHLHAPTPRRHRNAPCGASKGPAESGLGGRCTPPTAAAIAGNCAIGYTLPRHRGRLAPAGLVALSPSSAWEGVSSPPLRSASIRTSPSLLVASSAFTRRHLPPGRAEEESCQAQPRCESSEIYDGECRKLAAVFLDDRNLREHKQLTMVSKWQQKLHVASILPVAM